jgi:acyl carrier protein
MRDQALALVKAAVDELNEELDQYRLQHVTEETSLFGDEDGIDSLSLVVLIANLEQAVEETFGVPVELADEKAMSRHRSPYRTVGALTDFILEQLVAIHE